MKGFRLWLQDAPHSLDKTRACLLLLGFLDSQLLPSVVYSRGKNAISRNYSLR